MDEYLYHQSVHKDFHGILGLIFDYLRDNYGEKELARIFKNIAKEIYSPLIKDIKEKGLSAAEDHLKKVMDLENGKYDVKWDDGTLVFKVTKCPAIHHIKDKGQNISENYCRITTELVTGVISEEAGYKFSVDYNQDKGTCTQKFWKEDK